MTPALLDDLVRAAASEVLAVRGLDPAALPADAGIERPRNPAHGEYATSIALRTAGRAGVAARDLAGWVADALVRLPEVADVEVAGPGFLNLRMTADGRGALVAEVLAAGEDYGLERAAAVEDAADLLMRNAPAGLVAAVGVDAARYGLARGRAVDSRRTVDNPFFHVRYAHARAASLLRHAAELGVDVGTDLRPLTHPCEGELICAIGHFPAVVASGEPHRVARHLEALAGAFFDVHDTCPALPMGDADVTDLHRARLALVVAAHRVLANGLGLLGVSAPERI
ncbi:MAG TPA: DALR anticodon-binding domain-containing protein [Pseudonocardia sp.]|nr:DALR anticodon-binding domain-containing protein [Pseudonocardia sp.]